MYLNKAFISNMASGSIIGFGLGSLVHLYTGDNFSLILCVSLTWVSALVWIRVK